MPMTPEQIAQIQRYYHVEKWRIGTIARQLHIHHGSVERVLRQAGLPRIGVMRSSRIDPYLPFSGTARRCTASPARMSAP